MKTKKQIELALTEFGSKRCTCKGCKGYDSALTWVLE